MLVCVVFFFFKQKTACEMRISDGSSDVCSSDLASGAGEHLLLAIEKRGMNTAFAAKLLAQWAGVGEQAIGYAGLKDRHAVTRQRFSVHLPGRPAPDIDALQVDGLRVLDHAWHAKKLPRGALAGNRLDRKSHV